jgi:hypothetical protein
MSHASIMNRASIHRHPERTVMSTFDIRTRRAVARTVIVGTSTGVAALALASPASPVNMDKYIEVPQCQPATSQLCPQIPTVSFDTNSERTIKVAFTGNRNGCSDIIAHIFFDGAEWGSHRVGPSRSDGGYEIPVTRGTHVIGVQAEGIEGGCNYGAVSAWGGTLHIESLQDPNVLGVPPPPCTSRFCNLPPLPTPEPQQLPPIA